jgi:hypothetical protein
MKTKLIKLNVPEDFDKIPAAAEELKTAVMADLLAIFGRAHRIARRMKPGTTRVLTTHPVQIMIKKTA